jgi:hypothetical protein
MEEVTLTLSLTLNINLTLTLTLVYQEGIHLIESQPLEHIASRAFLYYREDQKIRAMTSAMEDNGDFSGMDDGEIMVRVTNCLGVSSL